VIAGARAGKGLPHRGADRLLGRLTVRLAFVVAMLLTVSGCATSIVNDAARRVPTGERSGLAPQAGGGGGGM